MSESVIDIQQQLEKSRKRTTNLRAELDKARTAGVDKKTVELVNQVILGVESWVNETLDVLIEGIDQNSQWHTNAMIRLNKTIDGKAEPMNEELEALKKQVAELESRLDEKEEPVLYEQVAFNTGWHSEILSRLVLGVHIALQAVCHPFRDAQIVTYVKDDPKLWRFEIRMLNG
jgi:SMC interacting uncharacterized protein involved in chromosome segregation